VTLSGGSSAYQGATKLLFERAYGKMLGICVGTACTTYKTGASVTSQASDTNNFRRGTVFIQFNSYVASADASTANTAATQFAQSTGQTAFLQHMTDIKAADSATYSGVTVPSAITGLAPTVTVVSSSNSSGNGTTTGGTTGGSTSNAVSQSTSWFLAVGLAALALRQ